MNAQKFERKLAAIFYADVAGYSRLTGADEAIQLAQKALLQPQFQWSRYAVLLSALGHLGKKEEVGRVLPELLAQRPDFSTEFVWATHLFVDPNYMDHYLDGLRKAGVN